MKMKAIIAAVALAMGIGANAAPEKVFTVQVADSGTLVSAATTAGNLVGYPMFGMMATMALADNPVNSELGGFRAGENALAVLYADPEKVTTLEELDKAFSGFAFIYAPAKSKQDFLTSQEGATEKDGVIEVNGMFLVYTDDGKWAALAQTADYAKAALADVAAVQKPMDGDFVKVDFLKSGVQIYSKLFSKAVKDLEAAGVNLKSIPSFIAVLDSVEACNVGVRIAEAGVDVRGTITPLADSELSKICAKPLEGDSFAFAPADTVYAVSGAEGAGCDFEKIVALYDGMVAAVKESGVNTDWYKSSRDGSVLKVTCDIAAAIKYFMSEEGQAAANAVNPDEFPKKIMNLYNDDLYKIDSASKPFSFALSLPGVDSKKPMSELFAKVLPEAAAKNPSVKSVYRYYSAVKALVPMLAAFVPEQNASLLNAGIATLPSDDDAGIASAIYRDGSNIGFASRVSAAEIRGFAALFNAGAAYFSMVESENCACDDEDDEDVEEDDDEE